MGAWLWLQSLHWSLVRVSRDLYIPKTVSLRYAWEPNIRLCFCSMLDTWPRSVPLICDARDGRHCDHCLFAERMRAQYQVIPLPDAIFSRLANWWKPKRCMRNQNGHAPNLWENGDPNHLRLPLTDRFYTRIATFLPLPFDAGENINGILEKEHYI